jgi:hypothetical protein
MGSKYMYVYSYSDDYKELWTEVWDEHAGMVTGIKKLWYSDPGIASDVHSFVYHRLGPNKILKVLYEG